MALHRAWVLLVALHGVRTSLAQVTDCNAAAENDAVSGPVCDQTTSLESVLGRHYSLMELLIRP